MLFHVANAAMLPLVGSDMTTRTGQWATALVAACILGPQLVIAPISPRVGQLAQSWGRRPVLLLGFAVLPLRGALLACTNDPFMIVAVQMLDGISGAVLGIIVPAGSRRHFARHRALQSRAGPGRQRDRHRRRPEHDRGGLSWPTASA